MNLRAFSVKEDAIVENELLLIKVSDTPKENVGGYFEHGTISYPLYGRLIRHLQSGNTFYINSTDKHVPYNHIARLSVYGVNEGLPEVKKDDIFLDAGFTINQ